MNGLNPLAQALAWTLLHFLWQGAVLGAAAWAALALLSRRRPETRYAVACAGLGLMALAPVATLLLLLPKGGAAAAPLAQAAGTLALPEPGTMLRLQLALQPWLPAILLVWCAGAALLALRLGGGLWMVHRLKTEGVAPAPAEWHLVLSRLTRALGIRRSVRLLRSARVEVPMVAGWLRPVILLPLSAFTQLSPAQLEAVLAHELAHVRRHDFLVNLLQSILETLLFYHPAVWWLSSRIREERELCCDDAAVGLCKDALDYARALALLEAHRSSTPTLALSAHGGSLMHRIHRLVHPQLLPSPRLRSLLFAGLALSALGASAYALQDAPEKEGRKAQSFQIIDDGKRLSVKTEGEVKLQPDQKDMVVAGKDGKFRLSEKKDGTTRTYQVEGDKRTYAVDGKERPLDAEGEAWLRGSLQAMEKAKVKAKEARVQAEAARVEAGKAREEAKKAMAEARRVQVQVTEENGRKHIRVMRDGKVETDELIEIPDIRTEERNGRTHIVVRRAGKIVSDDAIDAPEVQMEERDGKKHIVVRRAGKVVTDEIISVPKVTMLREGDRQRIRVEQDGQVVEDRLVELPEREDFKGPMVWSWEDGEGKEVTRFKTKRPGSRAEVDRLKAEVEALRKQVADLERQVGRTPKPPTPPKTN